MKYKKHQVEESNKPKRYVMQIDKPVNTYKPVSNHAHLVSLLIIIIFPTMSWTSAG